MQLSIEKVKRLQGPKSLMDTGLNDYNNVISAVTG